MKVQEYKLIFFLNFIALFKEVRLGPLVITQRLHDRLMNANKVCLN